MTAQMHTELKALQAGYFSGEISDEEWALLQVHMAYCNDCHGSFLNLLKNAAPGNAEAAEEPSAEASGTATCAL